MAVKPTGRVGLYVHVPFCVSHCPYCDFAVTVTRSIPHDAYLDAVLRELESRRAALSGRSLRTIYFGGGTPGLWRADAIAAVIDRARTLADDVAIDEITVELNPGRVEREWLEKVVRAGVDRVSLGAQSLDGDTLRALGRTHTPDDVVRSIDDAVGAGIREVSVDLIYGAPAATLATVANDARAFAGLESVDHVSAYELTWEQGTAFERRRRIGLIAGPEEDALLAMSDCVEATLAEAGLERYEVSNFARPGHEARHNSAYWAGHEYLGVGVGAHSLTIGERGEVTRRENVRGLRHYLADPVGSGQIEGLDAEMHLAECVMVAVRTRRGVDLASLVSRFGDVAEPLEGLVTSWVENGWVIRRDGRAVPTRAGLRIADTLGLQALEAIVAPQR